MIDLDRQSGFATDAHRFLHAFDQLIAFAAHVRRVFALIFGSDLAELDQLFSLGKESGRIDQGRRDAERPGFHLAPHQLTHLIELHSRRRFVFQANDVLANSRRANKRRDVLRDSAFFKIVEKLGKRRPLDIILHVALRFAQPPLHLIVQRPHRKLAENLSSHALLDLTQRTAVDNQRGLRVREHVDEARRDGEPLGIDNCWRTYPAQVADRRDAIAFDSHVGFDRCMTGAIVSRAAFDDDVERLRL